MASPNPNDFAHFSESGEPVPSYKGQASSTGFGYFSESGEPIWAVSQVDAATKAPPPFQRKQRVWTRSLY